MLYIFYISLALLSAVWLFYPLLLKVMLSTSKHKQSFPIIESDITPSISIIIAAHNEAVNLTKRCENILSQNYTGQVEIVIASDGSNDDTVTVVKKLIERFPNIVFLDIQPQGGRSNAHNLAIAKASHDILIFTDAETVFDHDCISKLVLPFSNIKIGFTSGKLKYNNHNTHAINKSVSLYWKLEMFLREAESQLGIYSTGTGACCAVRKSLYRTIPSTGDVDFITPLDSVLQGMQCIHTNEAIAWDELPESPKKEFKARIRMTSKNIKGTIKRWGFISVFKYPLYSISIFLHKIGRWLTPFFLISLFTSNLLLLTNTYNLDITVVFLFQVVFYLLGLAGYFKINFLYSEQIYSFLLANLGFLLGVLKAIFGKTPHFYRPVSQQ